MNKDNAIIQTENLSLFYTDFKALSNINISILRNNITALIGPSGCGKSTFLRTLNRMNDLVEGVKIEGKVLYEGKSIYSNNFDVLELRRKIGMVFQTPNPFLMSVYDNISYGPKIHGIKDKKKLDEVVEKSLIKSALWNEVKDKLNRNALSLSGGQQQRLCIARTLAIEPNVILMDEPTSALDPISTGKIEELIINLKESYTIIIVTHNMQQAGRISDQTAFFLNGYIEEESPTDELFFNPKNIKTEEYITGKFG
ncbi:MULTISPECIES: phosphate ABC transporter ATP-binding protein PstB [unclassified Borrelia]|uniref:phosphate ABC transporter ATP-binding protein PstB n=1 Tax=unclassified Borrelia TaxID=2649934 RepID=UPI001E60A048|nr:MULTISPECIES: phosphate ABC transporter ATP-binding protein PstB [unclassified Borrelia]UGQ15915.1 phosphate ABC transporter ATP-binding protein PstB [Borrelia sp. RT5S]UGQ17024.1 phosphate ABC transporter ATP-binding protein PstB [Borrelia sp. RT1S]